MAAVEATQGWLQQGDLIRARGQVAELEPPCAVQLDLCGRSHESHAARGERRTAIATPNLSRDRATGVGVGGSARRRADGPDHSSSILGDPVQRSPHSSEDAVPLRGEQRHSDVPVGDEPGAVGQSLELDPSPDVIAPVLVGRPGQVEIGEVEPLERPRFAGEPKDALDVRAATGGGDGAELQAHQVGLRFVACAKLETVVCQEFVREQHMRVGREVVLSDLGRRGPSLVEEETHRKAFDGAATVRLTRGAGLLANPERAGLENAGIPFEIVPIGAGRLREAGRVQGRAGCFPGSVRLLANVGLQLAAPVSGRLDALECDRPVFQRDSHRNRVRGGHGEAFDHPGPHPEALGAQRVGPGSGQDEAELPVGPDHEAL